MSDVARSRRDDARYEPHATAGGRDGHADPLAELARLVGQEDPFRKVFRPAAVPAPAAPPVQDEWDEGAHAGYQGHSDAHALQEHHDDAYAEHGHDGYDPHAPHSADHAGYAEPQEHDLYPDEAGIADERFAEEAGGATLPDLWAQGEETTPGAAPALDRGPAPDGSGADRRSSARRPLAVLAAVLVLTGGGLAASFLAKGSSGAGAAASNTGRGAPTIMAVASPTKIKVADANATAPEDQDAALLNKNANLSAGPVKIVSSQEQPADLGQLPKSADLADGARPLPAPSPSPFPEPKKVKTFVVHPDGSVLSGDGAAPGPASPDALGIAQPATPKTDARGGTTPRSAVPAPAAPATIAALAADPTPAEAAPPAAARQPAAPGARAGAAKPTEVASGGGYGLQLASSPVEADAQAAFAKMKKKYPALLGSLTATVHKAETGDKPVYRVRTTGMSQDEAKALCAKLQGAGGTCYVVRN